MFCATLLAPIAARADILVGVGPLCTVATIEEAIAETAATSGPDTILVSRSAQYRQVAVKIENQDVTIIGGFDTCISASPQGFVTIDGAGGTARSVFEIRGSGTVRMSGLQIRGGDEGADSDGGGIDYKGYGELILSNINISDNRAGYGGGIYFKGEGAGAKLTFGDLTIIQNNQAWHNGGGVHLTGRATMTMNGQNNIILDNDALGASVGNDEDGMGGGLYVKAPARANIGSSGLLGSGVTFYANQARLGGAVAAAGHADGHSTAVFLYSAYAQSPQRLLFNRASEKGGGLYLRAAGTSPGGAGIASVCVDDTTLEGNRAPRGAAVQLDAYHGSGQNHAGPEFRVNNDCSAELGLPSTCPQGKVCTNFVANHAQDENDQPTSGGIIEAEKNSTIDLRGLLASDNVGGSLLLMHDRQPASALLNSVVWRNQFSRFLIETGYDNAVTVGQSTIVANELLGPYLFKMGSAEPRVSISNTIIDQFGKVVVDVGTNPRQFKAAHVFTNASFETLPPANLSRIWDAVPDFVNADAGDFRLPPGSRAIDYGLNYNENLPYDIVGNARTVDRPEYDVSGWRDVGAYEMPTTPEN